MNEKKVKVGNAIEKAINITTQKLNEALDKKNTAELMADSSKHFLLFQIQRPTLRDIADLIVEEPQRDLSWEKFRIKDTAGNVRFRLISDEGITRTIYTLINSVGSEVGYIEVPLVSVGLPFETQVKRCMVYCGDSKICTLKRWKEFGDLCFEASGNGVRIYHNKEETDFKIRYAGRRVAHLYDTPLHFDSGYMDSFIMEYDAYEDEVIGVLLSSGVELINS